MKNQVPLKIYYDGLCPICSKEIDIYRKHPQQARLQIIDIASPHFDAKAEGLDPQKVHKEFHVKTQSGEIISGVDAFVEIWKTLDMWEPLQKVAQSKITRPFLDLGYQVFTKVRPYFRRKDCGDGYCATP